MNIEEINKLIAEKVFGYHWVKNGKVIGNIIDLNRKYEVQGWAVKEDNTPITNIEEWGGYWVNGDIPNYSSDIYYAWKVVEKMNQYGDFTLHKDCDSSKWVAELALSTIELYAASDELVPMVICKLALNVFNK